MNKEKHINDFGKLLIYNKKESKTFVLSSIFLPPHPDKESWGRLFVIVHLPAGFNHANKTKLEEDEGKFFNELIEEFQEYYYNLDLTNLEKTFEQALHDLNHQLNEQINQKEGFNWPNEYSIIVGVIKDNVVHLSQTGNIRAYLLRKGALIDIISSLGEADQRINPSKILSHIISGDLKTDDALLICTENLFDYLSQEKIKKIIMQESAGLATEKIKKYLDEINKQISFGAIIIKHQLAPEIIIEEKSEPIAGSMEKLAKKEKTTKNILYPSVIPKIAPLCQKIAEKIPRYKIRWPKIKIKTAKIDFILSKIMAALKKIYYFVRHQLKPIFTSPKLSSYFKKDNLKLKLATSPKSNRIAVIITASFAVLFILSLIWIGSSQTRNAARKNMADIIQNIEQKQNIAAAAIIYDEEKARQELEGVEEIIKNLPEKLSRQDKKKIALLAEKNQQELEKLRHINYLDQPEETADFWQTDRELVNIEKIILANGNLYTWNPKNNFIYKLNPGNKSVSLESNAGLNIGNLQNATLNDKNDLIFYHTGQGLASFNLEEKKLTPIEISPKISDKNVPAIVFYQKKLYLLDAEKNQIYKFSETDNGFSNGSAWLKEGADLSQAKSMAIDGSIFVSTVNNGILKFYIGKKQEFATNIKPDLESPAKIVTQLDWNNLYLIDPPTKRLIIIDKQGRLKNQYISEKFDNLKDLTVDEKNNQIYLLNGTKVYKITTL